MCYRKHDCPIRHCPNGLHTEQRRLVDQIRQFRAAEATCQCGDLFWINPLPGTPIDAGRFRYWSRWERRASVFVWDIRSTENCPTDRKIVIAWSTCPASPKRLGVSG